MTPARLAELSQRAYRESTWKAGGAEALYAEEEDAMVIAFRGTEFDFGDIVADLRGLPWPDGDLGWCHSGFVKGARRLWPRIARVVLGTPRAVVLTGHSKGAAEATLAAALMTLAGKPPKELVTFGSPRVGMGRLGRILAGVPVARYVNGADCVPRHPWPLWRYRHVGEEIRLGRGRDRFTDHRIAAYRAALG